MKIPPKAQLRSIANQYGLRLIVLFGSQVDGHPTAESDLDVAVLLQQPLAASRRLPLWRDLTCAFEAEVDLTLLNRADPVLLNRIARAGRLVYEATHGEWERYRSSMLRRYWDSTKFIEAVERCVARRARDVKDAL